MFLPEVPDVEASVGATGGQDGLVVRRPLYLRGGHSVTAPQCDGGAHGRFVKTHKTVHWNTLGLCSINESIHTNGVCLLGSEAPFLWTATDLCPSDCSGI